MGRDETSGQSARQDLVCSFGFLLAGDSCDSLEHLVSGGGERGYNISLPGPCGQIQTGLVSISAHHAGGPLIPCVKPLAGKGSPTGRGTAHRRPSPIELRRVHRIKAICFCLLFFSRLTSVLTE